MSDKPKNLGPLPPAIQKEVTQGYVDAFYGIPPSTYADILKDMVKEFNRQYFAPATDDQLDQAAGFPGLPLLHPMDDTD